MHTSTHTHTHALSLTLVHILQAMHVEKINIHKEREREVRYIYYIKGNKQQQSGDAFDVSLGARACVCGCCFILYDDDDNVYMHVIIYKC